MIFKQQNLKKNYIIVCSVSTCFGIDERVAKIFKLHLSVSIIDI